MERGEAKPQSSLLVVEDSRTQAERLRFLLAEAGYAVEVTQGGAEALESLATRDFDLVISDIVMPGMDGYALCRAIKALQRPHPLPVLLLTSLSDPEDVLSGLECGADGFVTKPYEESILLSRIAFTLANRDRADADPAELVVEREGSTRRIASGRFQILNFLLSTYETALRKHAELEVARDQLTEMNADLEQRVQERTATLRAEIRERVKAEQALRDSEDRFRDLFENVHDLVQLTDAEGAVLFVNRAWRETLEYGEEEYRGVRFTDLVAPDDRAAFRESFKTLLTGGRGGRLQADLVSRSGRRITLEGHLTCRMAGETVVGTRAIFRDVTAEKQLEEQYRQSQKIEAVGRLAGGIAHDFNNLLTAINGYSELMLDILDKGSPAFEFAKEIRKSGERAAVLTRQLLAYSRKQVLRPVRLNLNAVLEGMGSMLRRLLGEDVELRILTDPEVPAIQADANQLEQVILNLAVNSRDAMPNGGVLTLRSGTAEVIRAPAGPEDPPVGHYAVLSVEDTGQGISQEVQQRMFEPFFTTKEPGKGTGLGLSMVQGIVRQSGGFIRIESAPGEGAIFRIHLPAAADVGPTRKPEEVAGGEDLRGTGTILLVEDEDSVRAYLGRLLSDQGYEVLEARDGMAAMTIAEARPGRINLLLTDVVMARLGGLELWERFRALHPGTGALFMSGYSEGTVKLQGTFSAGTTFLPKPFTSRELLLAVRRSLTPTRGA